MFASTNELSKIISLVLSHGSLRPIAVARVRASCVTLRGLTDETADIPITAVNPSGVLKPAAAFGTFAYWIDVGLPWLALIFLLRAAWDNWRDVGIWRGFMGPLVPATICQSAAFYAPGFEIERPTREIAFEGGPTGLTIFRGAVVRVAERSEAAEQGVKRNWRIRMDTMGQDNHIVGAGLWAEWSFDMPSMITFELPPSEEELIKKCKDCWSVVGLEFLTGLTFPPEAFGSAMGLGHCIVLVLCYRTFFGSDLILRMLVHALLLRMAVIFQTYLRLRAWQKVNKARSISSYLGRKAGNERDQSVNFSLQKPARWKTLHALKMQ